MRSRIKVVTAGVVALGLLSGPAVSAFRQEVTLRYRWTKGETTRYRITQDTASTISGLPGMPDVTFDQSTSQVLRAVAEEVTADGTATLREVFESMKMDMKSPMFTMAYDSAAPDASDNPMNGMLKGMLSPMIGASFTTVMAPTGEVQKIEGLSMLVEKMFKNVAQDPAVGGVMEGLKANFTDEAMRSMFMQVFAQFPSRPLKVGDTWNTQVSAPNPMLGGMITSVTSTLKSAEGAAANPVATVATSLTIKQDASKPAPANPMGMTMQMGEGTGDGEQIFDAGTGRLRRSTTRVAIPMTMSGAAPDGTPMNMAMKIKTTTTVELVGQ
jgi:hypothetical protein